MFTTAKRFAIVETRVLCDVTIREVESLSSVMEIMNSVVTDAG